MPERIIVYRDAVSEGQTLVSLDSEVSGLKAAITNLMDTGELDQPPNTLFILANKRIEQRFSLSYRRGNNTFYENPPRGLVIDEGVTRADRFEFFMISHNGPTGLQTPIRYEVIYMEWEDLNPTDLYNLTNALCYGYYNLHNAVKIPSPLMYAHVY